MDRLWKDRTMRWIVLLGCVSLLAACATPPPRKPARTAEQVHTQVLGLLPARASDRDAWAGAIADAFVALDLDATNMHICAALAVAEQESGFVSDPPVAGLGKIARCEIDRRAEAHHIPQFVLNAALDIASSNGKSYAARISTAHTERELSAIYEDLIGHLPLGQRLLADANPVKTGGPMQVSIAFAERYAHDHPYPYPMPRDDSIRHVPSFAAGRGGLLPTPVLRPDDGQKNPSAVEL